MNKDEMKEMHVEFYDRNETTYIKIWVVTMDERTGGARRHRVRLRPHEDCLTTASWTTDEAPRRRDMDARLPRPHAQGHPSFKPLACLCPDLTVNAWDGRRLRQRIKLTASTSFLLWPRPRRGMATRRLAVGMATGVQYDSLDTSHGASRCRFLVLSRVCPHPCASWRTTSPHPLWRLSLASSTRSWRFETLTGLTRASRPQYQPLVH